MAPNETNHAQVAGSVKIAKNRLAVPSAANNAAHAYPAATTIAGGTCCRTIGGR